MRVRVTGKRQGVNMLLVRLSEGCYARAASPSEFIIDFNESKMDKSLIEAGLPDQMGADRARVISINCAAHAKHVSHESSLESISGIGKGKTVLFIAPGPSAKDIAQRIAPYRARGLKVCTLNLATTYVHDPDYVACYERLMATDSSPGVKREWYERVNPDKTKLLCAPLVPHELLDVWRDGKNVHYSWMQDMRGANDPRWACLQPLVGGVTTATLSLHALHKLGFDNILIVGVDASSGNYSVVGNTEDGAAVVSSDFYADGTKTKDSYVSGQQAYIAQDTRVSENEFLMCHTHFRQLQALKCVCEMIEKAGTNVVNVAGMGALSISKQGKLEDVLDSIYAEPQANPLADIQSLSVAPSNGHIDSHLSSLTR